MASQLPLWVQYVQALGIPVAGALIAAVSVYIAYQQSQIARQKLDHDRYDHRFHVFAAARQLLSEAVTKDAISDDVLKQFYIGTTDAPFHFRNDIVDYLKTIETHASSVNIRQQALANNIELASREVMEKEVAKDLYWLQQEIQSGRLTEKFRMYMALEPKTSIRR